MTWFRSIFSNLSFSASSTSIFSLDSHSTHVRYFPAGQFSHNAFNPSYCPSGQHLFAASFDQVPTGQSLHTLSDVRNVPAVHLMLARPAVMWWTSCEPLVNRLKTLSGWGANQNRNRTSKFCWHLMFLSQRVFSPPRELHVCSSRRNQSLIRGHKLYRLQQEVLQMHRQIIFG